MTQPAIDKEDDRASWNRSIVTGVVALVVALMLAFLLVPDGADEIVIYPCLVLVYLSACLAMRRPTVVRSGIATFASIELLFLFFYYLIFFWPYQQYVLFGTSLAASSFFQGSVFVEQSNRAIIAATLGLVAFQAGYRAVSRTPRLPLPETTFSSGSRSSLAFERQLAVIAAGGLIVLVPLYVGLGWKAAGEGRYTRTTTGGAFAEGTSLVILMLAMVAVALWVAVLARRERVSLALTVALGFAAYWAYRLIVSGDRNSFMLLAVVLVAGLYSYRVQVGRIVLLVTAAAALAIYTLVEGTRQGETVSGSLARLLSTGGVDTGRVDSSSFTITTVTLRASLAAVPQVYDFSWGWYKLVGFAGVVPFVRGFYLDETTTDLSSSRLLSTVLLPRGASWGVGTNVVSDIYVDFGLVGIPALLFAIGYLASAVSSHAANNQQSVGAIIFYLVTLALVAETPRYSLDFPARLLAWIVILLWVAYRLSRLHRINSNRV